MLCNLFYLYEKSSKKVRELRLFHKALKSICESQNEQVKPPKSHGTQGITHVVRSMTSFVDKFRIYIQHIGNIISDT